MKKSDGVNESFVNDILNLDDWQEDLFGKLQQPQYVEMDVSTDSSSLVSSTTASDTVTVSNVNKRQITGIQESSILLLDEIFSSDNNNSNDKNIADQDYNTLVDQSLLVDTESSVLQHFIIDSPNTSPLSTPRPKSILRSDSQSTIKQNAFKSFDQDDELIKSVQKLELEKTESVTAVDRVQVEEANEEQTQSQNKLVISSPQVKTKIGSNDVAPTLQSKAKDFSQQSRPQQQQSLMNLNDLLADMDTILSGGQHTELRSVAGKSSSHSTATSSSHKSSSQIQFASLMNQKQQVLDRSSVGSVQQIQHQQQQSHRTSPTKSDRSITSGGSETTRQIVVTQEQHQESSTSQSNASQVLVNTKTTLVRKKSMLPVRSMSNLRAQMTKQTLSNYDSLMSAQQQQQQQQPLSSNSPFKLRKKASSDSMKSQSLQQQQKRDIAAKQVSTKSTNSIGLFRRSQPVIKKQNQPSNTDYKSSDGSKLYPTNSTTSSASLEQNKSPSLGINSKLRKIFNSNSKNVK
ncbi:hypothetical protein MIR68_004736 [Amoeboaphelidium protococcarum]|nr:hypothetical protein MIR68_004736 [Amoeboaphelidium protococcarum]